MKREHVHHSLLIRLGIFAVISILLLGIVLYYAISDHIGLLYPALFIIVGMNLGLFISRIYHISWDKETLQVVSRFDKIGIVILICYVIFEIYRENIVSMFIQGPAVFTLSLALLTGIMMGRLLGIRGKIIRLIKKHTYLH